MALHCNLTNANVEHKANHNTKEASRTKSIIHEPHSANHMECTHFATTTKKGTGYWDLTWTPTHLGTDTWMNTRKTFCPGRGQKPAFWKEKYWIQRDLKSATLNPAKFLHIMSQHHRCTNDPSLQFNKCKCWTQSQSQHQRSLQNKINHPWASQCE